MSLRLISFSPNDLWFSDSLRIRSSTREPSISESLASELPINKSSFIASLIRESLHNKSSMREPPNSESLMSELPINKLSIAEQLNSEPLRNNSSSCESPG